MSPLTRSPPARKTGSGNFEPKAIPDQEQAAYPRSPSEECQDELSVSHKARKGADVGGIILLGEQLNNESTSSPKCLSSCGGGGGVTNGDEGDAQVCNATDTVAEKQTGTEGVSNTLAGVNT